MPEVKQEVGLRQLRCNDCAFTQGTDASKSDVTRMLAKLCAEIPEPFNCHMREGLCAGWAEAANALNAKGYHANQPDWRRNLKIELAEVINRAQEADKLGQEFDTDSEIAMALMRVRAMCEEVSL